VTWHLSDQRSNLHIRPPLRTTKEFEGKEFEGKEFEGKEFEGKEFEAKEFEAKEFEGKERWCTERGEVCNDDECCSRTAGEEMRAMLSDGGHGAVS
jgi:hypothetical protein